MHDFIIIGSGSSGGTLAKNLHEGGAKVLLLEAGKFFRHNTFPKTEMDYSAQLFWGGGIEFDKEARTAFLRAKCVGGTTIVNQCLTDRFDDLCLTDWKNQTGVDWFSPDAMAPYYEKVEAGMKLHTFTPDDYNENAKKFTSACDALGYKWKNLRRGMTDCKIEDGNDCVGCLGGCFRDSKQSSLVIAVQVAEKQGMEIKAEFEVDHIVHKDDHVVIYGTHQGQKTELKAKQVCLAGGSFGSTQIMLKSGFKDKLPALGKGFCQHPQYMLFGVFDEPVDAHKGNFQTVCSAEPSFRQKGFKLENVYAQPISIGMLFNSYGKEHQEIMRKYRNMSCIECAVRDEPAGGEINIDKKGNLVVSKFLTDQDKSRRDAGLETIRNIFHKQGVKEIIDSPFFFGLHLMGGCSIGIDNEKSVVNPDFAVHGHKNLHIADTSVYPSAPGINPSLTAATLATKLSENLLKN
ncbi:MAG: glucose-methanol-choline oxidoreductase [Flavobacteriales bacterium]|nr:MAG: glucose-methanol-choline oxidoreductase [Flavobacteriales bacterium]